MRRQHLPRCTDEGFNREMIHDLINSLHQHWRCWLNRHVHFGEAKPSPAWTENVQETNKTENQWDNYTNASDICTDSTLGLRNKYKHGCTQYRRAIPVAVLNTAESHCLLQRGNWSEKALCALIMNLQSLHETSCLLIISFGCKLITIIFICKIYSYTKKKKPQTMVG